MLYGGQVNVKRTASPVLYLNGPEDVQAVYDDFEREFSAAFSPLVVNRPGGVYLDNFVLKVTVPTPKPVLPEHPLELPDPSPARIGHRPAYWPDAGEHVDTPVYGLELLRPGHLVEGPAVVEGALTTVVVPRGMRYGIDRFGLGILESVTTPGQAQSHIFEGQALVGSASSTDRG
jgi:N-methylhydantoinase A/acetophenone carboxylase